MRRQASLILREAPWKLYDFCVNRCTNFNISLIFGLATPIELYTYDRNLPDSQTNPPWKYIEMVGKSINTKQKPIKQNCASCLQCLCVLQLP